MALLAELLDKLDFVTGDVIGIKFEPALPETKAKSHIRRAFWSLGYRGDFRWKVVNGEHIIKLVRTWRY